MAPESTPLKERPPLANVALSDLLELLCSESAEAGSGTAGSIAVALAAGCAAKAATISAKRSSSRDLMRLRDGLCAIARETLAGAERESRSFVRTLHSEQPAATNELLSTEQRLLAIANRLAGLLDQVEPLIEKELQGDLLAARALRSAGVAILKSNRDETLDQNQE